MKNIGDIELEKIMKDVVLQSQPNDIAVDGSSQSPNRGSRNGADIRSIVIHSTFTNRTKDAMRLMMDPASNVSTHYLISRDGTIKQLVHDLESAMHFGNLSDALQDTVQSSIGIHVVSIGFEFTNDQYRSCAWLCAKLIEEHGINLMDIVDTSHIVSQHGLTGSLAWTLPQRSTMDWKRFHDLCSMNLVEREIEDSVDNGESTNENDETVDIYSPQPAYKMALSTSKKITLWQRILSVLGIN